MWESGGCGTCGVDMLMTGERVLLLDTQPILSEVDDLPDPSAPDSYLEPQVLISGHTHSHACMLCAVSAGNIISLLCVSCDTGSNGQYGTY